MITDEQLREHGFEKIGETGWGRENSEIVYSIENGILTFFSESDNYHGIHTKRIYTIQELILLNNLIE